jgi:hypothetical protein
MSCTADKSDILLLQDKSFEWSISALSPRGSDIKPVNERKLYISKMQVRMTTTIPASFFQFFFRTVLIMKAVPYHDLYMFPR